MTTNPEPKLRPWQNVHHRDFDPLDRRWQALTIDQRKAYVYTAQDQAMERRGYTCTGVFPTDDSDLTYHFAYTIGLTTSFIVTGVSQSGEVMLDAAVRLQTALDGIPFQVLPDEKWSWAVFAPVPDALFRDHCVMALDHGAVRARQFVWMDENGFWPWEDGHHRQDLLTVPDGVDTMPILAGDDWRPTT